MNKKIWIILAAVAIVAAIALGVMFAGKNGEVADLKEQVNGLTTQVNDLTSKLAAATGASEEAAAMQAKIDELTAQVTDLTAKLTAADEALAAAQAQIEELTAEPVTPAEPVGPAVTGDYNMPAMNTTDPITLSVMVWDDFEMTEALAASFMEQYPNITVEIIRTTTANVTADLTNYAAAGTLPDVFMWLDLDPLLASPYMADIAPYLENDEEAQTKLYSTVRNAGYIDGKRCFFLAGEFLTATVYMDANVFEQMNVEMPAQDWTWDDFVELTQTMTDPTQQIWAYTNGMYAPVTFGPIALTENSIGEFGWNGESYNFESGWADALELQLENIRLGNTCVGGSDAYLAVDPSNEWPGQTGHVAVLTDASWTLNNIYTKPLALDRGIKMVPYNPPFGAENCGQLGFLDMVSISSQCEYPREAYELMKYLFWGKDGWLKRCELFPTIVWEGTETKAYDVPNCFPLIQDEEVNAAYAALLPDLGYWNDWENYLANIQNPVTWGARTIPGFNAFLSNAYNGGDFNGTIGIEAAVSAGAADPWDYTTWLAEQGRYYYDQAMAAFFEIYGQP